MAHVGRKSLVREVVAAVLALTITSAGWQTSSPPVPPVHTASGEPATDDNRSEKQKLLANEAQRLVAMATELKVEVDKTNKNILSLNVVRKAEQIEALAHRMKDQSKK